MTTEKENPIEASNKKAQEKIERFKLIIGLLEIRRKHFEALGNLKLPKYLYFLRAKWLIKSFEIEADMIAKKDFLKVYAERIQNVEYAESVIKPDKKGTEAVNKLTAVKNEE